MFSKLFRTQLNLFGLSLLLPIAANAGALASIYNGEQFQLEDQLLVQDADHPESYYYLPRTYKLKSRTALDMDGNPKRETSLKHRVVTKGDKQYSVYTMTLELDHPTSLQLRIAEMQIRRKTGQRAVIKGPAPVCGIRVRGPGFDSTAAASPVDKVDPDATLIQYSVNSTEAGKCASVLATTEFNLVYRVPISQEPQTAETITSSVGLFIPAVEILLPYKYREKVVVTLDAVSTYEQLKAAADLQGTFKAVTAGVSAAMSDLKNKLMMSGGIAVDSENPDPAIRDRFLTMALEILSKTYLNYLPMGLAGNTDSLVLADKEKAASASLFKVQLGFDRQSAERIGKFRIDFSNAVYGGVTSQVQIKAARASKDSLDPQVRSLLN